MQFVVSPKDHSWWEDLTGPDWLKAGADRHDVAVYTLYPGDAVVIPAGYSHGAQNINGRVVSINVTVCSLEGFPSMLRGSMKIAGASTAAALGPGMYELAEAYTEQHLCAPIIARIGGTGSLLGYMHEHSKVGDDDNSDVKWARQMLGALIEWCSQLAVLHGVREKKEGEELGVRWLVGFDTGKAEGLIKKMKKLM